MEQILNEAFDKAEQIVQSLKSANVGTSTEFDAELVRKVVIKLVLSKKPEIYLKLNMESGT